MNAQKVRFNSSNKKSYLNNKFSMLKIFIIFSILSIFIFLGYLIINPIKKVSDYRNSIRNSDVLLILSYIREYNEITGEIPSVIPVEQECSKFSNEICKIESSDCIGMVNLSVLNNTGTKKNIVSSLPSDPLNKSTKGTGYHIIQDGNGSVSVCAPYTEREKPISFEKYLY